MEDSDGFYSDDEVPLKSERESEREYSLVSNKLSTEVKPKPSTEGVDKASSRALDEHSDRETDNESDSSPNESDKESVGGTEERYVKEKSSYASTQRRSSTQTTVPAKESLTLTGKRSIRDFSSKSSTPAKTQGQPSVKSSVKSSERASSIVSDSKETIASFGIQEQVLSRKKVSPITRKPVAEAKKRSSALLKLPKLNEGEMDFNLMNPSAGARTHVNLKPCQKDHSARQDRSCK